MSGAAPGQSAPARRGLRTLALRCSLAAALLLGITTAIFAARDRPALAPVAERASRPPTAPAPVAADPILGQFTRRALNALLVPLLDDDEPPRWTDVGLQHFCGPATRVEINGQPLVAGAAIPATAFHVRWHIDQCWPLDYAAFELSGSVDLLVFHEDTGLGAIVSAQRLRIATAKGAASPSAPFAAAMEFGGNASPSPPAP
jgi:hypothetical protein